MVKYILLIAFGLSIVLPGCIGFTFDDGDPVQPSFPREYAAIKYTRAELDSSIQLLPPQEMVNSGKIYVVDDFLFVAEQRKGFHVFDNSDKTRPLKVKFIQALGSTDLAIRNNILYINQATDLISLEYTYGSDSLKLLKRIKNTFPRLRSPHGYYASYHRDSITTHWRKLY